MKKFIYLILLSLVFSFCNEENNSGFIKKEKTTLIGIQPFNNFNASLIDTIQNSVKKIYGFETVVLKSIPLPKSAYVNIKSPRYRADTLIRFLRRNKPDSIDYVIGLTDKDISTTKRNKEGNVKQPVHKYSDWGVFGLGFVSGPSCVVSTYRLKSDKAKFIDRFKKVCIHELGHNLGLRHCKYGEKCLMRDAEETIKTIDKEELILCKKCKSLINKLSSM